MTSRRLTRVNELLKREIGSALYRVIADNEFDLSAVTVTHVITTSNLRNARVLVSVRDNEDRRQEILSILLKHRADIQKLLGNSVVLKYTPRLSFALDTSLEEGDRTLTILNELDDEDEHQGMKTDDGSAP